MVNVLFVCLGNICRSPIAHGVFETIVANAGLQDKILIDSAGTGEWHLGEPPDRRAASAAKQRGYDLTHLRARLVTPEDFNRHDYILAMDRENLRNLENMRPASYAGSLSLFCKYGALGTHEEVPDPFYGEAADFETVLDLVEDAAGGLLKHIQKDLGKR